MEKKQYLNHKLSNSISVKGFTLIELVMVIVLLAVVSIVVTPRFFNRDAVDQRFLTDHVFNSIKYARKIAMASGCLTRFYATPTKYYIRQDKNCFDPDEAVDIDQKVWNPETLKIDFEYSYDSSKYLVNAGTFPLIFNAKGEVVNIDSVLNGTVSVIITGEQTSTINIKLYSIEVVL